MARVPLSKLDEAEVQPYSGAHDRSGLVYGWSAFYVGAFLLWYAIWTIECNVLVLTAQHYGRFVWAPIAPTLSLIPFWSFRKFLVHRYALNSVDRKSSDLPQNRIERREWALLVGGAVLAFAAAHVGNIWPSSIPFIVACATISAAVALLTIKHNKRLFAADPLEIGWRLPALIFLMFVMYYFAHRPDGDDANYINLAIGAQQTHGAVFQLDTMLGDGPNPIQLPTYKFHSFELLCAVLSTYTGLEPIAVFHLVAPALLLPFLALILLLTLAPAAGRYWFAASLLWLAFLFLNANSLVGWGSHGVIRLYQGKAFMIAGMLPLMAALTARWFLRGQVTDLMAMMLIAICSIGLSANGLYAAPASAAFVTAAFVISRCRSVAVFRRGALLVSTLAYPALVTLVILVLHLALPSERIAPTFAIDDLNLVVSYGVIGRMMLTMLAFSGLGLLQYDKAPIAALLYWPLAMVLILNPWSWNAISAATGNLGFRIFWSLPAATIGSLTGLAIFRLAGLRSEPIIVALSALILIGSIGVAALDPNRVGITTIHWHRPDLKVNRADYKLAERLARTTTSTCRILAPSRFSMLLSMIRGAPHPVYISSLYLFHYRFTLSKRELALRYRLRSVVDGANSIAVPKAPELASANIPIGTVAVLYDAPTRASAAELAANLGLSGPARDGPLLIWSGDCTGGTPH